MALTPQITYRNLDPSPALNATIERQARRVGQLFDRITQLRVTIEAVSPRHRKGFQFHVHLELGVPGPDLIVSRNSDGDRANEDAFVAVRDAFRALRRQLLDYVDGHEPERVGKDRRWEGLELQDFREDHEVA